MNTLHITEAVTRRLKALGIHPKHRGHFLRRSDRWSVQDFADYFKGDDARVDVQGPGA